MTSSSSVTPLSTEAMATPSAASVDASIAATNAAAIAVVGAFLARDALSPLALIALVVVVIVGPRWLTSSSSLTTMSSASTSISLTSTSSSSTSTTSLSNSAYADDVASVLVATAVGAFMGRALALALGSARVIDLAGPSGAAPVGIVRRVPYALVVVVAIVLVVSGVAHFVDASTTNVGNSRFCVSRARCTDNSRTAANNSHAAAAWLETLGGAALALGAYAALVFVVDDTTTAVWLIAATFMAGIPALVYGSAARALDSRGGAAALAIVASAFATALVACASSMIDTSRRLLTPHHPTLPFSSSSNSASSASSSSLSSTSSSTSNALAPQKTQAARQAGALACQFALVALVYSIGSAAARNGAHAVAHALATTLVVFVVVLIACSSCALCALRGGDFRRSTSSSFLASSTSALASNAAAAKRTNDGTQTIVTTWHASSSATADGNGTRARRTFVVPNARV